MKLSVMFAMSKYSKNNVKINFPQYKTKIFLLLKIYFNMHFTTFLPPKSLTDFPVTVK